MTLVTQEEYENLYNRALNAIRRRAKRNGNQIGEPYLTSEGVRFVNIDSADCNDELVFRKAWGNESAERIRAGRPQDCRLLGPDTCPDGRGNRAPRHRH